MVSGSEEGTWLADPNIFQDHLHIPEQHVLRFIRLSIYVMQLKNKQDLLKFNKGSFVLFRKICVSVTGSQRSRP